MRESEVMISSTMPSAKYSCSGSPLILAKGSHRDRWLVGKREAGTGGLRGEAKRVRRLHPFHRRDKAVAAIGYRLDATAQFSVLIENAAQRRYLDG
jgi:hypothetical protein